jgi:hypothetical protein
MAVSTLIPPQTAKGFDRLTEGSSLSMALDLRIQCTSLHLEILEVLELCGQGGLQRSFELSALLLQPGPVLLGPKALPFSIHQPGVREV